MNKLNKTFNSGDILYSNELNEVTSKVDEIIDGLEDTDEKVGDIASKMAEIGDGDDNADLEVCDEDSNILVRFANGDVETKNFNSSLTPKIIDDSNADLDIIDANGNVLARIANGHIKTKNFDSSSINVDSSISTHFIQVFPKLTTLGDSLMAGFVSVNGTTIGSVTARTAKNNWVHYLAERNGLTDTNLAVGSSTAHNWRYGDGSGSIAEANVTSANIDTDCYLVGIGVNDERQSLSVGTSASITTDKANNLDDFYGNYDFIVRSLMGYNTKAHIFCFTIPQSENNTTAYNNAIRHIANLYANKVHCIDLANVADYTNTFLSSCFINGHYTTIAYNYMSSIIEREINKYMLNNYSKFNLTPYV